MDAGNSAEFFKVLFGESNYETITLSVDINANFATATRDVNGGLFRLQAGNGGNNNKACFTLFGVAGIEDSTGATANAKLTFGASMSGTATSVAYDPNATYHLVYTINTKTYTITGKAQIVNSDGTYGEEMTLGTASYKNIVDYINNQYTSKVSAGTATTLDGKMKELAENDVFASFLMGRQNGGWTLTLDNYKVSTMVEDGGTTEEESGLSLNFDTTDDFVTYMGNQTNGLTLCNGTDRNGEIRENTYYNNGGMCYFEDTSKLMFGGLDTGSPFSYTVTFKMKMETFGSQENDTLLNIHGYNTSGGISNWNKEICVDTTGNIHMNGKLSQGVTVNKDEWFEVKLVVNGATKTETLFINGTECGSRTIGMSTSANRCGFRLGNGGGAKFYVDDFKVVKNG